MKSNNYCKKNYSKIVVLLTFLLTYSSSILAQKYRTYQSPKLEELLETHKTVAILPLKIKIDRNGQSSEGDNFTLKMEAERESFSLQLTSSMLWNRNKKDFSPILQAVEKTREGLNKMKYKVEENMPTDSIKKIAQILGVQGLLFVNIDAFEDDYKANASGTRRAIENVIRLSYAIYDGQTGELIWQQADGTEYALKRDSNISLSSNCELILERVLPRLPYFEVKKKNKNKNKK